MKLTVNSIATEAGTNRTMTTTIEARYYGVTELGPVKVFLTVFLNDEAFEAEQKRFAERNLDMDWEGTGRLAAQSIVDGLIDSGEEKPGGILTEPGAQG